MARFVAMAIVLQFAAATGGHWSTAVLNLSGILGTGIPLGIGLWYGAVVPKAYAESAKGGFILGIVGAMIGVIAAVSLGDQTWMLLTYAPLASGVTGALGAVIGTVAAGPKTLKKRKKRK